MGLSPAARSARRPPPPEEGGSTWKGDALFAAAVAVLVGVVVLRVFPELLRGQLVETDSYMRLVRVRRLLGPGGWFDGSIPRSDAPFGETLHWTRPVDVLLVLGAWLARPFLGPERALHLSGVLLSPILLVGVCMATAWAVRPLAGARMRYYAMLAVLAQVGIMGYALPGRADHNMLLLLAFTAMLGSAVRTLLAPGPAPHAAAAGAWAGFGLWVSTEFVMPVFALFAALLVVWVWTGEGARRARRASLGLLAVTAAAVALEHPPASLLATEYDRVSAVHLFLAGLVAAFWGGAAASRVRALRSGGRVAYAAAGAALAAGLMGLVYPGFFGGPMVDVDPELKRSWLPLLTEFQPYLVPRDLAGVGRLVAYLGPALVAGGVVAHGLRADRRTRLARVWVLLGLALLLFLPLGVRWVRFVMYAEILGVVGTVFLLSRILPRVEDRFSGLRLSLARAGTTVGLVVGPLLLGASVMALGGETGDAARAAGATEVGACPVEELVALLDDPEGLGDRPRTVMAHVDLGPLLLYRTPHSVVATPYHRNARGILDWRAAMSTSDPERARAILRTHRVDLVVVCGFEPGEAGRTDPGDLAFAHRLRTGAVPGWLTLRASSTAGGGFAVYGVE